MSSTMNIKIGNKFIGPNHPVFFIAEAGVNHNGSLKLGKQLIDAAVDAGADAVKFQTFKADELNTFSAPKSSYHIETTGSDSKQTWFDLLRTQEIDYEMHRELISYCKKSGIIFLSTPYGHQSADLLESLNIPAYKIASTDTNNFPLLEYIAKKGKPMILSTAFTNFEEIIEAVSVVRNTGLTEIAVLQCTGNYPSKIEDSNLNIIETFKDKLNCIVGYSDHTPYLINPIAATALGAKIYEKHFTIDRNFEGPDHRMSLEPHELKETVSCIRKTEKSLGSFVKKVLPDEEENRIKLRKSVVSIKDIDAGEKIVSDMLAIKRPGTGIPPKDIVSIIGKKAKQFIPKDQPINIEDI